MTVSYNKLWKLLIDLNMNKTQLRKAAGLSTNIIAKMSKNDLVSMDSLLRICKTLRCDVGDIMEVVDDSTQITISEYSFTNEANLLRVAERTQGGYKDE